MQFWSRLAWVVVALLMVAGCERRPAPVAAKPRPPKVTVARPIQRNVTEWDEYIGRLEAVQTVDVRARVSGVIDKAPFREGAIVTEGDVLFEIDPRPFQAQVEIAAGQLAQAQARLQLAKADLARAERVVGTGAISAEELDTRRQNVKQNEGLVTAAKGVLDTAQLNLEWTKVRAPLSGRVSNKRLTPGNLVVGGGGAPNAEPGGSAPAGASGGTPTILTQITTLDPIYCYVDADERSVLKYQRLAREKKRVSAREAQIPCYMQLANETDYPHQGFVDFVNNRADPNTGTLQARGVFPNPDGTLTPGFSARFRVAGSEYPNALLVIEEAIGTDQDRRYLLLLGPENKVRYQLVKLGANAGPLRVIEEGLTPDDLVVINGLMRARPGAVVAPELIPMPEQPLALVEPTTRPGATAGPGAASQAGSLPPRTGAGSGEGRGR